MSDIVYRSLAWHGVAKSEIENLGGNNIFEKSERKNNFEVDKVVSKNSVIYNHKDSISVHVDPNHSDLNKLFPDDSTNIRSFNDSANILAIERYCHFWYIWYKQLLR